MKHPINLSILNLLEIGLKQYKLGAVCKVFLQDDPRLLAEQLRHPQPYKKEHLSVIYEVCVASLLAQI